MKTLPLKLIERGRVVRRYLLKNRSFLLFFLIFAATSGRAQAEAVTVLDLAESFRDEVPVSGEAIAGVMLETPAQYMDADGLFAYLPEMKGVVCARITSYEGRYTASIKYSVSTASQGWYQLPTSSKHRSALTNYEAGQLVARIYYPAEENCLNAATYYWSRWGEGADKPGEFKLYLNSGRYPTFLRIEGEERQIINCKPIKETRNIAFDSTCLISPEQPAPQRVTVIRRKRGQFLPPIALDLPHTPIEFYKE